jgi:hypothetical protein
MSTYTGDETNNPASITIPSDGQGPIKAADVNPAFEGLADQIAHLKTQVPVYTAALNQASTTWVDTFTTNAFVDSGAGEAVINMAGCEVGDIFILQLTTYFVTDDASGAQLRVQVTQDAGGTNIVSHPVGAYIITNGPVNQTEALNTLFIVTTAGTTQFLLQGRVNTGGGSTIHIGTSFSFSAVRLRTGL